jgi:hypothetical protein
MALMANESVLFTVVSEKLDWDLIERVKWLILKVDKNQ